MKCPDCYSVEILSIPSCGDGKCSACYGTGEDQFLLTRLSANLVNESPDTCYKCRGSGECQTCRGTGEVEGFEEDSDNSSDDDDDDSDSYDSSSSGDSDSASSSDSDTSGYSSSSNSSNSTSSSRSGNFIVSVLLVIAWIGGSCFLGKYCSHQTYDEFTLAWWINGLVVLLCLPGMAVGVVIISVIQLIMWLGE